MVMSFTCFSLDLSSPMDGCLAAHDSPASSGVCTILRHFESRTFPIDTSDPTIVGHQPEPVPLSTNFLATLSAVSLKLCSFQGSAESHHILAVIEVTSAPRHLHRFGTETIHVAIVKGCQHHLVSSVQWAHPRICSGAKRSTEPIFRVDCSTYVP